MARIKNKQSKPMERPIISPFKSVFVFFCKVYTRFSKGECGGALPESLEELSSVPSFNNGSFTLVVDCPLVFPLVLVGDDDDPEPEFEPVVVVVTVFWVLVGLFVVLVLVVDSARTPRAKKEFPLGRGGIRLSSKLNYLWE